MMNLCAKLLDALHGSSLATAESCTGGGLGAAITAVPGSSSIYRGGVISYATEVKAQILGVDPKLLFQHGPISAPVTEQMVIGVKRLLQSDAAISVTGVAGPGGDEFGNPVGTVFIGTALLDKVIVREHHFPGNRDEVRSQAIQAALRQLLEMIV